MSKGQTKAEIAAEKLKKERATQKPLQYSAAPTTGLATQGPKQEYMSLGETMMSTSKANGSGYEMKGTGSKETHSPSTFSSSQQSKALRGFGDLTSGLKSQVSEGVSRINAQTKRNELSKGIADFAAAANSQTSKPSKKDTRLSNKISRTESRQASRLSRVMRRESQGKDATVTRQKLQSGERRLGRLKNKK